MEVAEGGTAAVAGEATSLMNWAVGAAADGWSKSGNVLARVRSRSSGSRGEDSAGGAYGGGDAFRRGASLEESRHMRPGRKIGCVLRRYENCARSEYVVLPLWVGLIFCGCVVGSGVFV